ncbi:hypothetical protein OBJ96_07395, partial [Empedobacter falsenii]
MRKFILFLIILGWSQSKAQVGIGTSTPNSATILDISSTDKGILIPRLTETERNTSLSDNDVNTVPPAGVVNTNLMAGTLIFNTTQNRFEFWDGTLWRQLFVTTSSAAGNDGVVRIDGGLNGTKPSLAFGENNGFSNTGTKKLAFGENNGFSNTGKKKLLLGKIMVFLIQVQKNLLLGKIMVFL